MLLQNTVSQSRLMSENWQAQNKWIKGISFLTITILPLVMKWQFLFKPVSLLTPRVPNSKGHKVIRLVESAIGPNMSS